MPSTWASCLTHKLRWGVANLEPIVSLVMAPVGGTNGQGVLGKRVGYSSLPEVVGTPWAALGDVITVVYPLQAGV